jgi:hypothetical protein
VPAHCYGSANFAADIHTHIHRYCYYDANAEQDPYHHAHPASYCHTYRDPSAHGGANSSAMGFDR